MMSGRNEIQIEMKESCVEGNKPVSLVAPGNPIFFRMANSVSTRIQYRERDEMVACIRAFQQTACQWISTRTKVPVQPFRQCAHRHAINDVHLYSQDAMRRLQGTYEAMHGLALPVARSRAFFALSDGTLLASRCVLPPLCLPSLRGNGPFFVCDGCFEPPVRGSMR